MWTLLIKNRRDRCSRLWSSFMSPSFQQDRHPSRWNMSQGKALPIVWFVVTRCFQEVHESNSTNYGLRSGEQL